MKNISKVISKIKKIDAKTMEQAQKKLDNLTKPQGSLGRLEGLAKMICGIKGELKPSLKNKVVFILAADHGVTAQGVSAYPCEVTAQMVYNFLRGGAGINVLAKHVGARVVVADMGVKETLNMKGKSLRVKKIAAGTKDMSIGPAMSRDEAMSAVWAGMELFIDEKKKGADIVGIGEMGIGNTTAASAIACAVTKKEVEILTGRGTGINDQVLNNKIRVIKAALDLNKPDSNDAWDVLSKVGGFEIAGMAGIILAAAAFKTPVVIDGFISGSAALIAYGIEPKSLDYMIASHQSVEPGHKIILEHLGLKPLFNLDMRLGEGTGAALGIGMADASIKILTQMATFESAGVSKKDKAK